MKLQQCRRTLYDLKEMEEFHVNNTPKQWPKDTFPLWASNSYLHVMILSNSLCNCLCHVCWGQSTGRCRSTAHGYLCIHLTYDSESGAELHSSLQQVSIILTDQWYDPEETRALFKIHGGAQNVIAFSSLEDSWFRRQIDLAPNQFSINIKKKKMVKTVYFYW